MIGGGRGFGGSNRQLSSDRLMKEVIEEGKGESEEAYIAKA
jgi:hypothetical protein